MEKILKAQTMLTHTNSIKSMMQYKNLELNPKHTIIQKLKLNYDNKNTEYCSNILNMLYNTSLLHSGYNIQSNYKYINTIYSLMEKM
jgi:HSP90 family molecular chaperone